EERTREAARVMEATGISDRRGQLIKQLSKGFRQRVGLAQALLGDPPVLILDEPTIGLDPRQIVEIRTLIKGMAGAKTVILSSHILPEVAATCSRVVIINQGRLVAEGPPSMLSPQGGAGGNVRLVGLGDAKRLAQVAASITGVSSVQVVDQATQPDQPSVLSLGMSGGAEARAELAQRVVEAGLGLVELTPVSLSLEEVFVQLTTEEKAPEQEEAA
ncbi:MAG: MFS transporter, partial [Desulfovibrio sp.]|nr:MFS transporter [Desulfovibrio sp.]